MQSALKRAIVFWCLSVAFLACKSEKPKNVIDGPPVMQLSLNKKSLKKLAAKRAEALKKGLLVRADDDYTSGVLRFKSKEVPIKIRLKGDWLDHLKKDKWSFRVKVRKKQAILGMQTFSLQSPHTRSFLKEWLFHKLLEQEGVLAPRYEFVELKLNERSLGIYAVEEHFDKHLLESKGRRAAPIVKFSEDGFWELQNYRLKSGKDIVREMPEFEASTILPFKKKKTFKDPVLYKAFLAAQDLMHQYKYGLKSASELFDIDKLARFYALVDVSQAYHSLVWHNMRFYYNPLLSKLEPVAYDCFSQGGVYKWFSKPFLGFHNSEHYARLYFRSDYCVFHVFNDPKFKKKYYYYLDKYKKQDFMEQFLAEHDEAIKRNEKWLRNEFTSFHFDRKFWIRGGQRMERELAKFTDRDSTFRFISASFYDSLCLAPTPMENIALQVYTEEKLAGTKTVSIRNFHCEPLIVEGAGSKNEMSFKFEPPVITKAYNNHRLTTSSITEIPDSCKYVYYRTQDNPTLLKRKVLKWPAPKNRISDGEIVLKIADKSIYEIDEDVLRFKKGIHKIEKSITIPAGYKVDIPAGCVFDIVNHASIRSYSPVKAIGTKEKPIEITSTDLTGQGFHILNCKGLSVFKWMRVKNQSTLQLEGWMLTGGMTAFKSDVEFEDCKFKKSRGEDALNIVESSRFVINNCKFSNCGFDALDIDFSQGSIMNCKFHNIKDDALDIAGGVVVVNNLEIDKILDKGITIGEDANVSLSGIEIDKSFVAVSVKDGSRVSADSLTIMNSRYGVTVFRKKPEYGKATLALTNTKFKMVAHTILVDSLFSVQTDSSMIRGNEKLDIAALFYKKEAIETEAVSE